MTIYFSSSCSPFHTLAKILKPQALTLSRSLEPLTDSWWSPPAFLTSNSIKNHDYLSSIHWKLLRLPACLLFLSFFSQARWSSSFPLRSFLNILRLETCKMGLLFWEQLRDEAQLFEGPPGCSSWITVDLLSHHVWDRKRFDEQNLNSSTALGSVETFFLATLLREDRKMDEIMTGTTEMNASNNPKVI